MIRVNILYPNKPGAKFDYDYYLNKHMPMSQSLLGGAIKGVNVEFGLNGGPPDSTPPYVATCHLLFESLDAFYAVFLPNASALQGDIANYTDVEPVIQISEVKVSR
jgi:uncharacterized protein (TIGR02118 family)